MRSFVFAILLATTVVAAEPTDSEKKREAAFWGSIGDQIVFRDTLKKGGYSVFIEGQRRRTKSENRYKGSDDWTPTRHIVIERPGHYYYALGTRQAGRHNIRTGPLSERSAVRDHTKPPDYFTNSWQEAFAGGFVHKNRSISGSVKGAKQRYRPSQSVHRVWPEWRVRPEGIHPRDFLAGNSFFVPFDNFVGWGLIQWMTTGCPLERRFTKLLDLVGTEPGLRGQINVDFEQIWKRDPKLPEREPGGWNITVTIDPAVGMMPVHIIWTTREKYWHRAENEATISWAKHGDLWLPSKIVERQQAPYKSYQDEAELYFHWLVGDEVPEEFFDVEAFDYRAAILDHYDQQYCKPFWKPRHDPKLPGSWLMDVGPTMIIDKQGHPVAEPPIDQLSQR